MCLRFNLVIVGQRIGITEDQRLTNWREDWVGKYLLPPPGGLYDHDRDYIRYGAHVENSYSICEPYEMQTELEKIV